MSQATIGATTAMVVSGYSGSVATSFDLSMIGLAISDGHDLLLDFTSDLGVSRSHQYVHFQSHAELGKIDAGLNRKQGIGQNAPLVVNFQIIHVCAIRMHFSVNRVAGPMDEVLA